MFVKRESLWKQKRAEWHKDAARTEVAESSFFLGPIFLIASVVLAFYGFNHVDEPFGWAAFVAAFLCVLALWGLRTGREWARWVAGIVAALLAVGNFAGLFVDADRSWFQWAWVLLLTVLWTFVAFDLLKPSARQLFERARG